MYNSHNIHQSITGNDLIIYEAIISFLTKLWLGNRIEEIYDLATTQFAFLLPMEDSDAGFVNNFLQPLLLKTPWLSTCDPKSKLIFINDLQAYLYSLQDPQHVDNINLQKEGRYLICNIQNMATRGRVTVELGAVQMVYDKDLVAASNKSILTLGSNPLLEPKSLCPTVRHTLSFVPSLNDMKNLAKFLFLKIFAESSDEKIGNDSYSDYCSDNKYYDKVLFEELLRLLRISINSNVVLDFYHRIKMNLKQSIIYKKLSKEQHEKLSSITYEEIFRNLNCSSNYFEMTKVMIDYLESNFNDETINGALVRVDREYWNYYCGRPNYWIYEELLEYYFLKAKIDVIKQMHDLEHIRISHTPQIVFDYSLKNGCIYKIFRMFEMSSKLQQPIIKHHLTSRLTENVTEHQGNREKNTIIDNIQAYAFYAEADITVNQVIRLSLNQVIETSATNGDMEKSTLPVCEDTYQLDDMFEAICTNIWNVAELDSESCQDVSNCNTKQLDYYTNFKTQLKTLINNTLMDRSQEIFDLDEEISFLWKDIHFKKGKNITHRVVMDIGILPYLKELANALSSSLKSKAMFGNYKTACIVITGELLHLWLTRYNSKYSEYMWTNLLAELSSQFYVRQIRAQLVLTKEIVISDHNQGYPPLKRQKYQQISSKGYFLNIRRLHGPSIEIYHCQEDKCSKMSATKIRNHDHWKIPLSTSNQLDGQCPIHIEEEFFIHLKKSDLHSYQDDDTMKWILYSVGMFHFADILHDSAHVLTSY
ncbi:hypothetical protein HMPREF1544_09691 [Mucor circinelloides 1006PhL]|uniref:Uncharacterized protein n=1 Tax=Mucor circinelloides f. circinelloides (strain 1006PhL) TaxID=1220926 RepID=S2JUQ6_MUCC1|nr:hypothetical protein HMPREF1544_09691 [Mucor circinelloides 1006PhL]